MSGLSIWHWIIAFIYFGPLFWAYIRIVQKAGFSGFWALLMLVPLLNVVGLIVLAAIKWPAIEAQPSRPRAQVNRTDPPLV